MSFKNPSVRVVLEENLWEDKISDVSQKAELILKDAWKFAFENGGEIPEKGTAEISVFLINDARIKELNKEYRGIDKPTNVLSFPALDTDEEIKITDDMTYLAGDILVSLETSEKEAMEEGKSLLDHLTHLLIHGVLHLAGFDHINDDEADVMEGLEIDFLAQKGIKNPYENLLS